MEGCAAMADRLFEGHGFTRLRHRRRDDLRRVSPMFFLQLEALGFCGPGEAKDFIADGNLGPQGSLPCNTNGGLIGEGYIHGLNLTAEAIRQLRGKAATAARRSHDGADLCKSNRPDSEATLSGVRAPRPF